MPASTIRGYRNRNGIFTKKKFDPPVDEFIEKYLNKESATKLAEEYGVDRHDITSFAKEIGVYIKPYTVLNEEQIRDIEDKYWSHTSTELAIQYGVSASKISRIWSDAGLHGKDARLYRYDVNYFNCINSYDKAYFLGFIGSDGCIYYPNDDRQIIIKICIQKQDVKVLQLFKDKLSSNKPIYIGDKYATFEISSNIMGNDLCKLGLTHNKTYGNTIANIDYELMPHLIRGYFDGDGAISNCYGEDDLSHTAIQISGYKSNLSKIQKYLESKNIFTVFCPDIRKYNHVIEDEFGALTCQNNTVKYCFLKLIYDDKKDCFMDRKYNSALKFIDKIEKSKEPRNRQIVQYYKYAVCGVG